MAQSVFTRKVYEMVARIPRGRVATYGQIALLAGYPRCPRQVGQALRHAPRSAGLPCHRVVNRHGRPAPCWPEQRWLLEAEGVFLGSDGTVDLSRCQWSPRQPFTPGEPGAACAAPDPTAPAAPEKNPTGRA